MVEYQITDYRPSEQGDLVRFFREVLGDLGFDFDLETKGRDLCRIPEVYQSNDGRFLLAGRGGRVIGTIAVRQLDEGTCELKRFYVLKDERGNGVGTDLLDQLIAHAKAGPCDRMRLDTSSRSPAAVSLFRKRGFVEIPRYNDDPFAEVFMELSLR
jgi:ribosomal protein S18 acetylase RimI-like enzyme